ncbi:hypothetical protein N1851_016981 [Merluccius polli]|uniref:Uncharacterized protein n=1 Tax=Merluccius polli TaxID=89951 RepID=A0AA47MR61_MERPO|nr:hypothetical protein N1851_016981 [Merluccius polli]
MCIFVDNNWATQLHIHEKVCTPHYELLSVSFRPFYLPREFGQTTIILTYIPGPKYEEAVDHISESYNNGLSRSVDQPIFILRDFNNCELSSHLPTLQQYIDCPTRLSRTLDKCYGNIPNAFKAVPRPPLGKSDHSVIHLLPRYKAKIKQEKPTVKEVALWSDACKERLRDCFDYTDWDKGVISVLRVGGTYLDGGSGRPPPEKFERNANELTESITSYITFCENNVAPKKTVKIYPNNKVWVSREMKRCLCEKRAAFAQGNMTVFKEKRRELRDYQKS